MPFIARLRQALLICLPIVATYLVVQFLLVRTNQYGSSMAFALFIGLPVVVLGFPWSMLGGFIEPVFRGQYSIATLEQFVPVIYFSALYINTVWLVKRRPFHVVLRWSCILCSIQFIAFVAFH